MFRLFIKILTNGEQTETLIVSVDADKKIEALKAIIEKNGGPPVPLQRLIFAGRELLNEDKVSDYLIKESTIHLVIQQGPKSAVK